VSTVVVESGQVFSWNDSAASNGNALDEMAAEPSVTYKIDTVWCIFQLIKDRLPFEIDLKLVGNKLGNVEYQNGRLYKKVDEPKCTAIIFEEGVVRIQGCKNETECLKASRIVGRMIQQCSNMTHQEIRIRDYRVESVVASGRLPYGVMVDHLHAKFPKQCKYNQEKSPEYVTYTFEETGEKVRIHIGGSFRAYTKSVGAVPDLVENKLPKLLNEFRKDSRHMITKKKQNKQANQAIKQANQAEIQNSQTSLKRHMSSSPRLSGKATTLGDEPVARKYAKVDLSDEENIPEDTDDSDEDY